MQKSRDGVTWLWQRVPLTQRTARRSWCWAPRPRPPRPSFPLGAGTGLRPAPTPLTTPPDPAGPASSPAPRGCSVFALVTPLLAAREVSPWRPEELHFGGSSWCWPVSPQEGGGPCFLSRGGWPSLGARSPCPAAAGLQAQLPLCPACDLLSESQSQGPLKSSDSGETGLRADATLSGFLERAGPPSPGLSCRTLSALCSLGPHRAAARGCPETPRARLSLRGAASSTSVLTPLHSCAPHHDSCLLPCVLCGVHYSQL